MSTTAAVTETVTVTATALGLALVWARRELAARESKLQELKSRPLAPHPLFASFIAAAKEQSRLV